MCACGRARACACARACAFACVRVCARARPRVIACVRACVWSCPRARSRQRVCVCVCVCMCVCVCARACPHPLLSPCKPLSLLPIIIINIVVIRLLAFLQPFEWRVSGTHCACARAHNHTQACLAGVDESRVSGTHPQDHEKTRTREAILSDSIPILYRYRDSHGPCGSPARIAHPHIRGCVCVDVRALPRAGSVVLWKALKRPWPSTRVTHSMV